MSIEEIRNKYLVKPVLTEDLLTGLS